MVFSIHHLPLTIYRLAVELRHCFFNAVAYDGAQRFGAALQNFFDLRVLRAREAFEHVGGSVAHWMLGSDADAKAHELVRAERRDDVLQALLAAARTSLPQTYRAEGERDVVADDEKVARSLEPRALLRETRDRLAAQVHVGLRLYQLDRAAFQIGATDERPALGALNNRVRLPRQKVDEHEAEVVARPLVTLARIAEADDEHKTKANDGESGRRGEGVMP